jgi:hypothetical protein
MKSSGFGAFNCEICVHTNIKNIPILKEKLGIDPIHIYDEKGSATFMIEYQNRKTGDDETVVWTLMHIMPSDVGYSIDWSKSDY